MADSSSSTEAVSGDLRERESVPAAGTRTAGFRGADRVARPEPGGDYRRCSPAEQVKLQWVSSQFLPGSRNLAGNRAALPRGGGPRGPGARRDCEPPVVDEPVWKRQPRSVHRVRINNVPARIVGVAPPGFFGLRAGEWNDVYAPLAMRVAFQPRKEQCRPSGRGRHRLVGTAGWPAQAGNAVKRSARLQITGLLQRNNGAGSRTRHLDRAVAASMR